MSTTNRQESSNQPPRKSATPLIGGILILLVGAGAAFWGIQTRARTLTTVTRETNETTVPIVAVTSPEMAKPQQDITLPGTLTASADAPIFARTNGYVKRWFYDIGARVGAGDVLAEIDTPEVDQQLLQARADLANAEANMRLAKSTAERYRDLIRSNSVSQQDLDNANGNLDARAASVESAKANVRRLEQLQAFAMIEAPFDGVITARNVDVGALVGGNQKELFHVAATYKLRLFVNVPQIYSQAAKPGIKATLTLKEFPGRTFTGTLARTAQSIDVSSRTMLTEIEVENPKGELLAGSYAEVRFQLPAPISTMKLPVSAVIFKGRGTQVAAVRDGGRVEIVPVALGRDFGDAVEVVSGLQGSEQVIINPADSLTTGQPVKIAAANPKKKAE